MLLMLRCLALAALAAAQVADRPPATIERPAAPINRPNPNDEGAAAGGAVVEETPETPATPAATPPVEELEPTKSLRDIILETDELTSFRDALDAVAMLENLLDDPTKTFTVFAPSNQAMKDDGHMVLYSKGMDEKPPRWNNNLVAALNNHIAQDVMLDFTTIFDRSRTVIETLQDDIIVSQWSKQVGYASIETQNIKATNGILHIVKKVIRPEFFDNTFAKLELQSEYGPDWKNRTAMVDVVDFVGGRNILQTVLEEGTTYAGCRIRAFNRMGLDYLPQTINDALNVKYGELLNASFMEETKHSFLEYHMIPRNFYLDQIPNGFQELVTPVADCAHMWVTMNNGKLCFNDGCVVSTPNPRTYLSSNGVGYVIDKCPICPGIAMMAKYASEYTIHGLNDVSQLFVGSEWNLRNLSQSVGTGQPLTLFTPINSGYDFFTLQDTTRLATDKWKRHLWDLLKHLLVEGKFSKADLKRMVLEEHGGNPFNMTMLTGEQVLIGYDTDKNKVTVDDGDLYFSDVRGVDGLVHFVSEVPKPRSITHTVYDIAAEQDKFRIQISYINALFLREDMKRLSPLTAFYAPNEEFEGKIFDITEISETLLENHIFKELLWCERLVEWAGERIESHNGQTWLVSVNDEGMPCFDTVAVFGQPAIKSCVTKCDILARNGIVHELDKVLIYEAVETRPPTAPTAPTPPSPASDVTFSRPKYPSPTPGGDGSGGSGDGSKGSGSGGGGGGSAAVSVTRSVALATAALASAILCLFL